MKRSEEVTLVPCKAQGTILESESEALGNTGHQSVITGVNRELNCYTTKWFWKCASHTQLPECQVLTEDLQILL